ncbi:MAG: hypothetical protein J6V21_06620 [Alistipes sp.]|nr:hypothetical protein [Alistipes sp.]
MANYENVELIVWYNGTLASFKAGMFLSVNGADQLQQNDKTKSYADKIVFITGTTATGSEVEAADKVQAIWVSQTGEDGRVEGKFLDMANVEYISKHLTHISGITVDGTTYYPASGGGAIKLGGSNGITVEVDTTSGAVTFNGADLASALVGNTTNESDALTYPNTITGAKAYTDAVATSLKGTKATNDTTAETIAGAKEYADAKISDAKAELKGTKATNDTTAETIAGAKEYADNAADVAKDAVYATLFGEGVAVNADTKILPSRLPDVILGQLMYGGIIGDKAGSIAGTPANIAINPSSLFEDAFGKDVPKENLTPTTFLAENYRNVYFIVGNPNQSNALSRVSFSWNDVDYNTGDWFLSDGEKWTKIDNTDAVSAVAGLTGAITAGALANELTTAASGYTDPLAKKSDIKIDGISAKASVDGTDKTYFSTTGPDANKNVSFTAEVKTMSKIETDTSAEGFADARDVYNFLKARLSIKVVSNS